MRRMARLTHHVRHSTLANFNAKIDDFTSSSLDLSFETRLPSLIQPRTRIAIVAMSGGLDSCMTAWLMKNYYGLKVFGMFMKTWDSLDEDSDCNLDLEADFCRKWAREIDVQVEIVDLVKEYWNGVFDPFVNGYQRGLVPNPDVLCNSEVKFGHFLAVVNHKMQKIGVSKQDYVVATGHYARNEDGLRRALDPTKDQSFFLSLVKKQSLNNVMFPLGSLQKSEVRKFAETMPVFKPILAKKESMGICMIGRRKLSSFLSKYLIPTPGRFLLQTTGFEVGRHGGAEFFTLGQLAKIPSRVAPAPRLYIVEKVMHEGKLTGDVIVALADNPILWTRAITCSHWQWLEAPRKHVQILPRTHAKCVSATVTPLRDHILLQLEEPVWILGLGQTIVAYHDDLCLGSGLVYNQSSSIS
jgi:tRNA (5-methylaminomethyl-2-thiouridylate)-methyltransferase